MEWETLRSERNFHPPEDTELFCEGGQCACKIVEMQLPHERSKDLVGRGGLTQIVGRVYARGDIKE